MKSAASWVPFLLSAIKTETETEKAVQIKGDCENNVA
jgi:hypothetical protein